VLANVDELEPGLGLRGLGDLGEERRLLGARDHAGFVLQRFLEAPDLLAAQLGVHLDRPTELERALQRLGVERHGLVAVADLQGAILEGHSQLFCPD
jgi:hypothetical protein